MWPTLLTSLIPSLLDKLFPDPAKAGEAKLKLLELQQAGQLAELEAETKLVQGQLDINKNEALSQSVFVAGWRPFVGWTCGGALAYVGMLEPLLRFVASVGFGYTGTFPVIDTTITMQVLFGMLGLGAMRSFDKSQSK